MFVAKFLILVSDSLMNGSENSFQYDSPVGTDHVITDEVLREKYLKELTNEENYPKQPSPTSTTTQGQKRKQLSHNRHKLKFRYNEQAIST